MKAMATHAPRSQTHPRPVVGRSAARLLIGLTAALALACGGGSGGGSPGGDFRVVAVNVAKGQKAWQINRALRVTFDRPVAASTVSHTTFNVHLVGGAPAFGEVLIDPADPRSVLWRPDCPTLDDLSDSGLDFGVDPVTGDAYEYELAVIGADGGAFAVSSTDGEPLKSSFTRRFETPQTTLFNELFVDDVPGPPRPVLRPAGGLETEATHLLVGGVAHYFERQVNGSVELVPPLDLPLNLFAGGGTDVVLELQLDQAVDMRLGNVNTDLLRLEFEAQPGLWQALAAEVTLESNCGSIGARLRLTPEGVLPPGCALRAVIDGAFSDLVGHANGSDLVAFAPARTVAAGGSLVDSYLERFISTEREEQGAVFGDPRAEWGGGELSASFSFDGGGGPGGDFDVRVKNGEVLLLSTIQATLVGGPGFVPQKQYTSIGGVFDLRNFVVEPGGVVKFEGPNPVTLYISGYMEIGGQISIDGTPSKGVQSTNTTALPEIGGPGQAGGGEGGTGSFLSTASTSRGGSGQGAFGGVGFGGEGGEAGYASAKLPQSLRRGGGGGGGRLGLDVVQVAGPAGTYGDFDQSRIGLDAENGFDNPNGEFGVFSGAGGPKGGARGARPFIDNRADNDFFGIKRDLVTSQIVFGELKTPWAGSGGGAGGDSAFVGSETYPPKWTIGGDEKGAGGGGGAGSLRVLALGDIRFIGNGNISARGGLGGGGENHNRTNRVGGGSGGGSGGHVILETAAVIDFRQSTGSAVVAVGGQGGAGADDEGGAYISNGGPRQTSVKNDACPPGYPTAGTNACRGQVDGAGGDGGPGMVQLHTSSGVAGGDILLPAGLALGEVTRPAPLGSDGSYILLPSFGRLSRARSEWVPMGEGGYSGGGPYDDVAFAFDGLDAGGFVLRDAAGGVAGRPPLLATTGGVLVGYRYTFAAGALIGTPEEALLQRTALLDGYLLELRNTAQPLSFQRFEVVAASYDPVAQLLTVDLDANGPPLESFVSAAPIAVELQPAFFRVRTDARADLLPPSAAVQIRFEATGLDPLGQPQMPPVVPWTSDVADLNFAGNADLRFFRFEVLFDVDHQLQGLRPGAPQPALEYLRLPFRYR